MSNPISPSACKRKLKKEYDRGVICGIGLACSIIQSGFDEPVAVAEALAACNLNRAKLKRAGVDDYDLKMLRPAFRELK